MAVYSISVTQIVLALQSVAVKVKIEILEAIYTKTRRSSSFVAMKPGG